MSSPEIPRAVRAVLSGGAVLDGQLTAVINADGRKVTFTPREWDVLELLLDGLSTREIADRLAVRPITGTTPYLRRRGEAAGFLSRRGLELLRGQHGTPGNRSGPDT